MLTHLIHKKYLALWKLPAKQQGRSFLYTLDHRAVRITLKCDELLKVATTDLFIEILNSTKSILKSLIHNIYITYMQCCQCFVVSGCHCLQILLL